MRIASSVPYMKCVLPLGLSLIFASCSGPMTPPESVEGTQVSSIQPMPRVEEPAYSAPRNAVQSTETLNSDVTSGDVNIEQNSSALATSDPDGGVNMDAELGVGDSRPVGLAEEQANDIAEGNSSQPIVDGIGTDEPIEMAKKPVPQSQVVPFDESWSATEVSPPIRKRRPDPETKVALLPRFSDPMQRPQSFGGMTAADRACRQDLEKMGVRFKELSPISDGQNCGIAHPILVSGFAGNIQLKPAAKLNCGVTRMFAKWVKNELVPSARFRYLSGVKTIHQMSSYSCRRMNSRSDNPWSEHAHGNAIDIGKFVLKSGKEIDVRKKGFFAFREKGLLKTVREDSCRYFSTVLGPGDAYHGDHFHFDMRERKSGRRHCSL